MNTWSIPLEALADKTMLDVETVTRKSTLDLFGAVGFGAPVDLGQFRANMNVSYGVPDVATTESTNEARLQQELDKVLTLPIGGVMYITNALPYAAVLEYGGYPNPPKTPTGKTAGGFSIQAPLGVFRIAAIRYSEYVQKAIK